MTNRIDTMPEAELRAATKALVDTANKMCPTPGTPLSNALKPFEPTPLDELREWLKENGFVASTPSKYELQFWNGDKWEYFETQE